jgi:diguanylate cyclase (GGDEF)-like protein
MELILGTTAVVLVIALGALVWRSGRRTADLNREIRSLQRRGVRATERNEQLAADLQESDRLTGTLAALEHSLHPGLTQREIIDLAVTATARAVRNGQVHLQMCGPGGSVEWSGQVDLTCSAGTPLSAAHNTPRCIAASTGNAFADGARNGCTACPNRGEGFSTCVPLMVHRRPVATIHVTTASADDLSDRTVATIHVLAARARRAIEAAVEETETVSRPLIQDRLTSLPAREACEYEIDRLMRRGEPFAVAVMDLDNFGAFNRQYGEQQGDQALQMFANVLRSMLRPSDLVARWESDEFVAVFPNCSAESARAAMERVRERLVLELAAGGFPPVSASVGVVDAMTCETTLHLLDSADAALSQAKEAGGNRVHTALD